MTHRLIENLITWLPILCGCPGATPFDPERMDEWACTLSENSKSRHAVQLVLHTYAANRSWRCGVFDAVKSMQIWDEPEQIGYVRWAASKFFTPAWINISNLTHPTKWDIL